VIEPLFYSFPNDDKVFENAYIDSTFMVGGAIKVTPILWSMPKEVMNFTAYFPSGIWVDLNNFNNIYDTRTTGGANLTLSSSY
jgi:alpha-glucosidase (family GH31 glycosyl hydrolase)